jgi:guanosine-3',5'-bis(diphosphate) 3'-pyrophosphohydrolase
MDTVHLLRALSFAALKHRDQRRKDPEASPYINHPIAVASSAVEGGVNDEGSLPGCSTTRWKTRRRRSRS